MVVLQKCTVPRVVVVVLHKVTYSRDILPHFCPPRAWALITSQLTYTVEKTLSLALQDWPCLARSDLAQHVLGVPDLEPPLPEERDFEGLNRISRGAT